MTSHSLSTECASVTFTVAARSRPLPLAAGSLLLLTACRKKTEARCPHYRPSDPYRSEGTAVSDRLAMSGSYARRHQTCDFGKCATSAPAELGGKIHNVSRTRARTQVLLQARKLRVYLSGTFGAFWLRTSVPCASFPMVLPWVARWMGARARTSGGTPHTTLDLGGTRNVSRRFLRAVGGVPS